MADDRAASGRDVLVDSNVILDVLTEDVRWFAWSSSHLAEVAAESPLVINPIIYAEVSIRFDRIEELDDAVPSDHFRREALPGRRGSWPARRVCSIDDAAGGAARLSPISTSAPMPRCGRSGFSRVTRGDTGRISRPSL